MRRATEVLVIAVFLASVAGCSGLTDLKHTSGGGGSTQPSSVVVSPATAIVQPFGTQAFTASVSGSSSAVTWQVNGLAAGSQTGGPVSNTGTYSAPFTIPQCLVPLRR